MRTALTLLALFTFGCATAPAPATTPAATVAAPECDSRYQNLHAALWLQSSAEYEASAMQTYAAARRMLDVALADPTWTAATEQTSPASSLPPAVILDLDETALDNSQYEAQGIVSGNAFTPDRWKNWVAKASAKAVPGAAEFLQYAKSRGVTPFYITNRNAGDEEAGTLRNLQALNFPVGTSEDTLLTRGEHLGTDRSDKTQRRAYVASKYRVLLLLGDDLNDFVYAAGKSISDRDAIIRDTANRWGTQWFILPNPSYGSWEKAASGGKSDCEAFRNKLNTLQP